MILTTPALSAVVQDRRTAGAPESTLSLKMFPGGCLALGGANTPNTLARWSVRVAVGDDCDRFPPVVGDEGDPGELLANRTLSFHDRLAIFASTPVMRGGRIDTAYARSDRRRFFVRCPACGRADFITWNDVAHFRVAFEEHDPLTAHLRCPDEDHGCGARIDEPARRDLIARGEWRPPAAGEGPRPLGWPVPAARPPRGSLP